MWYLIGIVAALVVLALVCPPLRNTLVRQISLGVHPPLRYALTDLDSADVLSTTAWTRYKLRNLDQADQEDRALEEHLDTIAAKATNDSKASAAIAAYRLQFRKAQEERSKRRQALGGQLQSRVHQLELGLSDVRHEYAPELYQLEATYDELYAAAKLKYDAILVRQNYPWNQLRIALGMPKLTAAEAEQLAREEAQERFAENRVSAHELNVVEHILARTQLEVPMSA